MSKFVNKLQNLSKSSVPPIGFRSSAGESKGSTMLLIAGLSGASIEEAEVIANSNVDAGLLLSPDFNTENVRQIAKAMGDIPLGVLLRDTGEEKLGELAEAGYDFVVFDTGVPITVLQGEKVGKFLMVETSLDQGLARAINGLDIDGVLINRGEKAFVTVEHLLICQRFSELLDKPLIAILSSPVTSAELGNLWKGGIDAIVIPPAQPSEVLAELKAMVENLPKGNKRQRSKTSVVLPHYSGNIAAEEEEEDEEEI